jgi:hypothetical protein
MKEKKLYQKLSLQSLPPPNIKLCIWSYTGERERDKETHTDKETDRQTDRQTEA